jgi:hypothetical protein
MERRVEHVELIDCLVARLVCRFMDHGETPAGVSESSSLVRSPIPV